MGSDDSQWFFLPSFSNKEMIILQTVLKYENYEQKSVISDDFIITFIELNV